MKILSFLAALAVTFPLAAAAQQAVPESPAIWREVTGVINTYPGSAGTTPVPAFTVAGNSSRVVADYRDDVRSFSPLPGWSYQ